MDKYSILNSADFSEIAKDTGYKQAYVRQVLRGNSGETKFNQKIFDSANELIEKKIKAIRLTSVKVNGISGNDRERG